MTVWRHFISIQVAKFKESHPISSWCIVLPSDPGLHMATYKQRTDCIWLGLGDNPVLPHWKRQMQLMYYHCKEPALSFRLGVAESASQITSGVHNVSGWSREPSCSQCQMPLSDQWRQSKESCSARCTSPGLASWQISCPLYSVLAESHTVPLGDSFPRKWQICSGESGQRSRLQWTAVRFLCSFRSLISFPYFYRKLQWRHQGSHQPPPLWSKCLPRCLECMQGIWV